MIRILACLLATLLVPSLASTQDVSTVDLRVGESISFRIGTDGGLTLASRNAAPPMADFEAADFRRLVTTPIVEGVKSQPPRIVTGETLPPPVARGTIRFTLRVVPPPAAKSADGDMLLTVENGGEGALRYRAVLHRGDRAMPSDVCIVMPGKRGYEHWPYRFDRIGLLDIRFSPWRQGDAVTCE
jgi:hypothetical protein